MISFEELSQKYPIRNVAPYGACVVVPGAEFDPDWEVYLSDQGYCCIMTDLDGKPVTLVQRKSSNGGDMKEVYAPHERENFGYKMKHSNEIIQFARQLASQTDPAYSLRDIAEEIEKKFGVKVSHVAIGKWLEPEKKSGGDKESMKNKENKESKGSQPKGDWLPEENDYLLVLWNQTPVLRNARLVVVFKAKFPSRSPSGILNHLWTLQKAGKIEPRFKLKRKGAKAPEKKASEDAKSVKVEESSEIKTLFEAYDALSKAYVELKTEVSKLHDFVIDQVYVQLSENTDAIKALEPALTKHKHAQGSGEAMLPMEASE